MNSSIKRIYRSRDESVIFGICGGLGDYFRCDPVLIRLIWIVAAIFTAVIPTVIVYLIAAAVIPAEPWHRHGAAQERTAD